MTVMLHTSGFFVSQPSLFQPGPSLSLFSLTSACFSPSSHSSTAYLAPGLPSLSLFPAWVLVSSLPLSLPRSLSLNLSSHSSLLSQSSLSKPN